MTATSWVGHLSHDAGITVTYTVTPHGAVPTTTIPAAVPQPAPAVTHQPLPLTGAPVTIELVGSFGLLLAGAVTAWCARRPGRRGPPPQSRACNSSPASAR